MTGTVSSHAKKAIVNHLQKVQSVVAAHQVLQALSLRAGGTTLTDLARDLDMTPSRVLRHLTTLVDLQLVERTGAEPVYRLGIGLIKLARHAALQHDVARAALPVLRRLNDQFGQATFLVRRQGQRATVWLSFDSQGVPHLSMPPGMSFSLSGSACGRVLLAFDPDTIPVPLAVETDDQFPDPVLTLEELRDRIVQIRACGYDSYGTDRPNAVFRLAAPILNDEGNAVAAIGLVGFSIYFVNQSDALIDAVRAAAKEVSRMLGGHGSTE